MAKHLITPNETDNIHQNWMPVDCCEWMEAWLAVRSHCVPVLNKNMEINGCDDYFADYPVKFCPGCGAEIEVQ